MFGILFDFIISDTFTFFIIGLLICQVFLFSLTINGFSNNFLDWNNCFVYHIPIFINLKSRPFILFPFIYWSRTAQWTFCPFLYLSTNNNTSRQSTLPSYAVIGWNICKITKFLPCCQLSAVSPNTRKKLNGLDFILFNNLLHFFL